jgi:hypothetical protein
VLCELVGRDEEVLAEAVVPELGQQLLLAVLAKDGRKVLEQVRAHVAQLQQKEGLDIFLSDIFMSDIFMSDIFMSDIFMSDIFMFDIFFYKKEVARGGE